MLSAAVASAAPQVATQAECTGSEQMVSFQTPLPGNLAQAMSQFIEAHPQVVEARLQQVKDTPPDVFLSVFWIYATTEMAPWLHQVKCPCLVLTGELDGGCNPRLNRFMHEQLPDSRLVILDGLKHSLMIEASDQVLPHLRDFLLEQTG